MDAGKAQQNFLGASYTPATSGATKTASANSATATAVAGDLSATQTQALGQVRSGEPGGRMGPGQPALQAQAASGQQARGRVLTDPAEIFQHEISLGSDTRKAFEQLSPDQQKQFRSLVMSQVVEGTKVDTKPSPVMGPFGMGAALGGCVPGGKPTKEQEAAMQQGAGTATRTHLYHLLNSGKLTQADSKGQSLLSNLETLHTQKVAPGVDRDALLRGTVADVNQTMFLSASDGPVASGELQRHLASKNPSEYVRTIGQLASPQGKAQVGGATLQRNDASLKTQPLSVGFQTASSRLFTGAVGEKAARTELFRQEVSSDPQAAKQFASLSADDRKRFESLYQESIPAGNQPKSPGPFKNVMQPTQEERDANQAYLDATARTQSSHQERSNLTSLLSQGKLSSADSKGASLLTNLDGLKHQKFAKEGQHQLDGSKVYQEVLNQVAHPGDINQGARGTCTVTTLEHLQATRQPSEYVRVMKGLTGTEGSVVLRNGQTLPRAAGVVAGDDSGRTSASRVYQASMMEFGNGPDQIYRNDQGGHFRRDGSPILDDRGKLVQGLPMKNLAKVSSAVMGGDFRESAGTMQGAKQTAIEADFKQAVSQNRPIEVGMRWSRDPKDRDSYHALSLYKVDDEYVYLRNPWGAIEHGHQDASTGVVRQALAPENPGPPIMGMGGFGSPFFQPPDPNLPKGEAGTLRVKKSDFYANLDSYVIQR